MTKDETRTNLIARKALNGQPPNISIPRLMTLALSLCDMLDDAGIDADKLLREMTFKEEEVRGALRSA